MNYAQRIREEEHYLATSAIAVTGLKHGRFISSSDRTQSFGDAACILLLPLTPSLQGCETTTMTSANEAGGHGKRKGKLLKRIQVIQSGQTNI